MRQLYAYVANKSTKIVLGHDHDYRSLFYLTISEWGWISYEEIVKIDEGVIPRDRRLRRITPELIFDSARLGLLSPANILQIGDVATLSCLLAVLAMFLAIISPSSYSWNEWNVRHFCFHNQNNSTSFPGLLG